MAINLENFEDRGRNSIQLALANQLYGDLDISPDEMIRRWVDEGYAKRFGDYLAEHPDLDERLFIKREDSAYGELVEKILYH